MIKFDAEKRMRQLHKWRKAAWAKAMANGSTADDYIRKLEQDAENLVKLLENKKSLTTAR